MMKAGRDILMKKTVILILAAFMLLAGCRKEKEKEDLYTIGIFQVNDAQTLNDVRKGFIKALEDNGLFNNANIRLIFRNAMGSISEAQKIAREFVSSKVNMIVSFSTPCLQAALRATDEIPIVFSSVANPYLAGAGNTADDHLKNVSGVSSQGPIKESLVFLKEALPDAGKIGTLWTPSELNSEFYLNLAKKGASELGLEIVTVPVSNASEVLHAAQVLINKGIDAIFQISDNTTNVSFGALGKVAEDNAIPLFGGFPPHTKLGACAAMGWDFVDMGYKAGQIAFRVKNGESPAQIPFQYMTQTKLHLNLKAASSQGIEFSDEMLERADEIIGLEETILESSVIQ
jgi:putative ABC transport system substrate-binding protein